jgi:hypothetical protein
LVATTPLSSFPNPDGKFVNGTWDIVIIMLGTNDAKDPGNGGAPNWPAGCSNSDPNPASCTVIADYLSLLAVARTLGVAGRTPLMAVMRPPPLWRDSDYGMNQTVLNDVMPHIVPTVAGLVSQTPPDPHGPVTQPVARAHTLPSSERAPTHLLRGARLL